MFVCPPPPAHIFWPVPKHFLLFFCDKTCRFQSPKLDDCCQFVFFDVHNHANYTLGWAWMLTVQQVDFPAKIVGEYKNLPSTRPHFQICVKGKQTIFWRNNELHTKMYKSRSNKIVIFKNTFRNIKTNIGVCKKYELIILFTEVCQCYIKLN